jgi:hypothetical protein
MASHATCRHKDSHKRFDCRQPTRLKYESDNGQASLYQCVEHHREAINEHALKGPQKKGLLVRNPYKGAERATEQESQ